MVRWHRQLDGHEFEQTPGESERQGSLACSVHGAAKSSGGHNIATKDVNHSITLIKEIKL